MQHAVIVFFTNIEQQTKIFRQCASHKKASHCFKIGIQKQTYLHNMFQEGTYVTTVHSTAKVKARIGQLEVGYV